MTQGIFWSCFFLATHKWYTQPRADRPREGTENWDRHNNGRFLQTVENRPFSSSLVPLLQNESYENDFDLYGNEPEGGTHFHINGFTLRLVLTQRHKRTRKWPITDIFCRQRRHAICIFKKCSSTAFCEVVTIPKLLYNVHKSLNSRQLNATCTVSFLLWMFH